MKVFVFGNGNIPFYSFMGDYEDYLRRLIGEDVHFIVCDFRGVDTLTMEYLKTETENVSVYYIGEKPRYLPDKFNTKVSKWGNKGGFKSDSERDLAAIEDCTHFLATDFNSDNKRVSGTKKNIDMCLSLGKIPIID